VAIHAGARVHVGRTGPAVTRVLGVLIHNWPLKLAAIGLATLLYGGLVLSQSSAILTGVVPVTPREQPTDTFLLTTLRPVTEIRYFTPSNVRPISSDFEAWVDLSDVTPGGGRRSVPIQLRSIDPRVRVLGFEPQTVTVELDPVAQKTVPIQVERGDVPVNMSAGAVTVDPAEARVIGPASVLARVVAARASVIVQPSGIDVDQDVELVPIDSVGDAVAQVRLEPATARVTIPIFSDRQTRQLSVSPQFTGSPAAGFEQSTVSVEPRFITVEGDADELEALVRVDTVPIPITGLSASRTFEVELALPTGVVALDAQEVTVSVGISAVTATRSFEVGLRLIGVQPDLAYRAAVDRVLITVGGSTADLDRLVGATLAVDLDVTTLGPGTTDVLVTAALPPGITLAVASPPRVQVVVTARPTPPPS
jgi:YbbR domain-containing protein